MSLSGFPDVIDVTLGSGWTGKDGLSENTVLSLSRIGTSDEWSEEGSDTPSGSNRLRLRPGVQFGTAAIMRIDVDDGGSWYEIGYASAYGQSTYTFLDVWNEDYPFYSWFGGYTGGWLDSAYVSYNDEVFKLVEEGAGTKADWLDPAVDQITHESARGRGEVTDFGDATEMDVRFRYRQPWEHAQGFDYGSTDWRTEAVALSPDGTKIVVGSDDDNAYIFDVSNGTLLHTLDDASDPIRDVDWSPDGSRVVTASGDGNAYLYDADNGDLLHTLDDQNVSNARSCAFSNDSSKVVVGTLGDTNAHIHLYNVSTGAELDSWTAGGAIGVVALAWSPDDTEVIGGLNNGNVEVWDPDDDGNLLATVDDATGGIIRGVAYSPDGELIVYTDDDEKIYINSADGDRSLIHSFETPGRILSGSGQIAFSPDGSMFGYAAGASADDRKAIIHSVGEGTDGWDVVIEIEHQDGSRAQGFDWRGGRIAFGLRGEPEAVAWDAGTAWTLTDVRTTLTSTGSFEETIAGDLEPETEYEVQFVLEGDDDSQVTSSTETFTTLEEPEDEGETYLTTFDADTAGQRPADFTDRWGGDDHDLEVLADSAATDGKLLRIANTAPTFSRRLESWDVVDDEHRADFQMRMRFRMLSGDPHPVQIGRASGAAGNETGYVGHLADRTGDPEQRIIRYVDGGSSTGTTGAFAHDLDVWYEQLFEVRGANQRLKTWKAGDEEPEAWGITWDNTEITEAGWIGIGSPMHDTVIEIDAISVGTGDQDAPALPELPPQFATFRAATRGDRAVLGAFSASLQGRRKVIYAIYAAKVRGARQVTGIFRSATIRGRRAVINAFRAQARGRRRIIYVPIRQTLRGLRMLTLPFRQRLVGRRMVRNQFAATLQGRRRVAAIFIQFRASLRGRRSISRVFASAAMRGRRRVANDALDRYEVYVGIDAAPDTSGAPDATGSALPIAHQVDPAPAGETRTYHIVTLIRNRWGMRWQVGKVEKITLNDQGEEITQPPSAPTFDAEALPDGRIRITGEYRWREDDEAQRADQWLVWAEAGKDPDRDSDQPIATLSQFHGFQVESLEHDTAQFAGGPTVHVLVRVARSSDDVQSVNDEAVEVEASEPGPAISREGGFHGRRYRQR